MIAALLFVGGIGLILLIAWWMIIRNAVGLVKTYKAWRRQQAVRAARQRNNPFP